MKESFYDTIEGYSTVNPLIEAAGFSLIQLDCNSSKSMRRYSIVVYRPQGVSLDDCVLLHKTLLPRLEMIYPHLDIYIDIMSPGVGRVIKSASEFACFLNLPCKVLLDDDINWIEGVIVKSGMGVLSLMVKDEQQEMVQEIPFAQIKKAKLL